MMRWLLLWLRTIACYHDFGLSPYSATSGMPYCNRCGCVWHKDGNYFGRYTDNKVLITKSEGDSTL